MFRGERCARHMGGGSVVSGQRTRQQDDLKAYLTNDNNGMPAFSGKLHAGDIADVASYVASQAQNGWS